MRGTWSLLFIVALVVSLVAFVLLRGKDSSRVALGDTEAVSIDSPSSDLQSPPTTAATSPPASPTRAEKVAQVEGRYGEFFRSLSKQFTLHGLAIDTAGAPIADANVTIKLGRYGVFPKNNDFEDWDTETLMTDPMGRFQLEGKAASVRVHIAKDGYIFDETATRALPLSQFDAGQMKVLGTSSNPRRFVGWKISGMASRAEITSGRHRAYFKPDGQVHPVAIPKTDLTLNLAMTVDAGASKDDRRGWSASLGIDDGGVRAAPPGLLVEAPEQGYQPIWSVSYATESPDWEAYKTSVFFVRYGSAAKYASLIIEWDPHVDRHGDAMATIEFRQNKTGSRVLATRVHLPGQ